MNYTKFSLLALHDISVFICLLYSAYTYIDTLQKEMGDSFSFHQPQVFFYHNELHKFFIICLTRHNILYLPIYIVRILDTLQKEMGDSFSFHQPQVFFYYNELHKMFIISLT